MELSAIFNKIKTKFSIDNNNFLYENKLESIVYCNTVIFCNDSIKLIKDKEIQEIKHEDIEYFFVDKISLMKLHKSELTSAQYHFSIKLVSKNKNIDITIYTYTDYVVFQELLRLFKIRVETQNSLK